MTRKNSWRTPAAHKPLFGQKLEPFPATRFFDQLSFIGNANVGCFVLETSDGLILLDCMEPLEEHRDTIVSGFHDLGLDLKDLKAILITHGHGDHYGKADWFRAQTGCKVYMSEIDEAFAKQDIRNRTGVLTWSMDGYLTDDTYFTLGDTRIYCCETPGHTPGGMSFIFPVTDEGRPHMVAMWGGTGIPYTMSAKVLYLESTLKFAEKTAKLQCDAEISTHPFVDKGTKRLQILRDISDGIPNPFVLGTENYKYYEKQFTDACLASMKIKADEADKLLPPMPPRKN